MVGVETGTAADYHELNAGAHRKPPKVLSAPSLVWHLAFWSNVQELGENGEPLRNDDGSPKKRTAKHVKDTLDRYIVTLYQALVANENVDGQTDRANTEPGAEAARDNTSAAVQLTPCISETYLLFGNAYSASFDLVEAGALRPRQTDIFESTNRTVTLQFVWEKLDVTVRFEVHTEYFSISTFVEFDRERMKARTGEEISSIPELNESTANILRYLNDASPPAYTADSQSASDNAVASEEAVDVDTSPQQDDVAQTIPAPPSPASGSEGLVIGINRFCFHEFWTTYEREILSSEALARCAGDVVFSQVFADFRGLIASDQAIKFRADEFFESDKTPAWGWDAKRKFLPLIQHRNRAERSRYECTVNYMLDGRAIYLSTLGPQIPTMGENQRTPVEFIIYAHQRFKDTTIVNKWQLGRLVSQLLLLGTLRLCALKDVKLLHEAGQQLGLLEESTQKARVAIALSEAEANTAAVADATASAGRRQPTPSRSAEAMRSIAEAHRKLNDITGTFLRKAGTGLLYRIERSRYYVQQFDENVKLLRIKRLEGDQPYDQFIRRRLGSEFDFINRLGIRYERATTSIVTLDQNYLAITQNSLVERATKIDEETYSIQSDIQKIQRWGEFVLLAVLVPYYFMHLLVLLLGEEWSGIPSITFVVWGLFFIGAFFRMFRKTERARLFWSLVGILSMIEIAGFIVFIETVFLGTNPQMSGARSRTLLEQIIESQRRLENTLDKQLGFPDHSSHHSPPGPVVSPTTERSGAAPMPEQAPLPQQPSEASTPGPSER